MANYNPPSQLRGLAGALVLLTLLLGTGLAFAVFGMRGSEPRVVIFGIIFILLTAFVFRKNVPTMTLVGAFVGLICGAGAGAAFGAIPNEMIAGLVALIGAMVLGATGAAVFGIVFIDAILGPVLHIGMHFVPKVTAVFMLLLLILGAIWGAMSLRPIFSLYFAGITGAAIVGGILGVIIGMSIGTFRVYRPLRAG